MRAMLFWGVRYNEWELVMLIKEEGDKVNFIDEHDHFVGYDTGSGCCEHAGWFISDKPERFHDQQEGNTFDLKHYYFTKDPVIHGEGDFDEGGMVIFTLGHIVFPPLYLHIFNSHNGYYSHGVETDLTDEDIYV